MVLVAGTLRTWSVPLLALSVLIIAGCASTKMTVVRSPRSMPPRPAFDLDSAVLRVFQEHNQIRLEKGLSSLTLNAKLQKTAQAQADDQAKQRKMSHDGSDGSTPFERMERAGYTYNRAAENVAFGQYTVDELMEGWMNSPPHRKNILGGFTQVGVACAVAENGIPYWCVTFGLPKR